VDRARFAGRPAVEVLQPVEGGQSLPDGGEDVLFYGLGGGVGVAGPHGDPRHVHGRKQGDRQQPEHDQAEHRECQKSHPYRYGPVEQKSDHAVYSLMTCTGAWWASCRLLVTMTVVLGGTPSRIWISRPLSMPVST